MLVFGLAWFVIAVALYLIGEGLQKYLYDQTVNGLFWRAAVAAVPLAALMSRFPCEFDVMFTSSIHLTLMHCAAWLLAFWLLLRFQFAHALLGSLVSFGLIFWMVTLLSVNLKEEKLPTKLTIQAPPTPEEKLKTARGGSQ